MNKRQSSCEGCTRQLPGVGWITQELCHGFSRLSIPTGNPALIPQRIFRNKADPLNNPILLEWPGELGATLG
jgi:hypothetical protein